MARHTCIWGEILNTLHEQKDKKICVFFFFLFNLVLFRQPYQWHICEKVFIPCVCVYMWICKISRECNNNHTGMESVAIFYFL